MTADERLQTAVSMEELIRSRQKEYYDALGAADKQADSAGFVELMLEIIKASLKEATVLVALPTK